MSSCVGVGRGLAPLSCDSSLAAHLIKRNAFATELLALRQESLARVALHQEGLVLFAKLIPQIVEVDIMGANNYMAQLMQ